MRLTEKEREALKRIEQEQERRLKVRREGRRPNARILAERLKERQ